MPGDNIQRAIQKGEGTAEGTQLVEATYEGYGPGGAAIMVDVVSDNKNRAVQELRSAFTRAGGNLGENGSVAWILTPEASSAFPQRDRTPTSLPLKPLTPAPKTYRPRTNT
jgi:transcriptional/translational regulatory protein YebC/TACO1